MAATPREERKDKKDRKQITRERFIQAALDLLRAEGIGGVTVSQVSKRIEVHHTLFYAHFEDIPACLAAAAHHVLATLAPVDRELRRELTRRAVTDRRALARYFEDAFERWMKERPCVELLLAHRLDRSALGEALRPAFTAMRDELATELWDMAAQMGLSGRFMPEVRTLADLQLTHWLWGLEMIIDGRALDRPALAALLADTVISTNLHFLDRARRPAREDALAQTFTPEQRAALQEQRARLAAISAAHDDAFLIERAGGAVPLVERVIDSTRGYFMPGAAGTSSARVRYCVTCPDGTVINRDLVVQAGVCTMSSALEETPTIVLAMSLRTLLDTMTNTRHFDHAFRAGDVRVEGDLTTALAYLDWFDYYP
jgi:AcrR family transcriptional regulator